MSELSAFSRLWCVCGALLAACGTTTGALAAHLSDERLAQGGRTMLHSIAEIQMWHALALITLGLTLPRHPPRLTLISGCGLLAGTIMFSTSVYYTALSGNHAFRIAPAGGSLLIISWCALAVSWAFSSSCFTRKSNKE